MWNKLIGHLRPHDIVRMHAIYAERRDEVLAHVLTEVCDVRDYQELSLFATACEDLSDLHENLSGTRL